MAEQQKNQAEQERLQAEEAAKKLEQQRLAAEAARQKAEEERKRVEEQRRKIEQEKQRAEEERLKAEAARQKAEEDQRRAETELALQESLAAEQRALDSARRGLLDVERAEYIAQIQASVQRNWFRPTGTARGLRCSVRVEQIPGGEVIRVSVTQGSGNVAFDRSVVEAVQRASPLPQPKDPSLFAREIIFEFHPED